MIYTKYNSDEKNKLADTMKMNGGGMPGMPGSMEGQ